MLRYARSRSAELFPERRSMVGTVTDVLGHHHTRGHLCGKNGAQYSSHRNSAQLYSKVCRTLGRIGPKRRRLPWRFWWP